MSDLQPQRMAYLLCDETNVDPGARGVDFFVYGGLVLDSTDAFALHTRINEIRGDRGFKPADRLKWQSNSRPAQVSKSDWNAAKSDVLAAAATSNCALITVMVHHRIAKDAEWRHIYQMDSLVRKFNSLCLADGVAGMVFVDRVDGQLDEFRWMKNKLADGLVWPATGYAEDLGQIVLYGNTSAEASRLASALDIALGALAYCVNDRRPDSRAPKVLMPQLEPLLRGYRDPDSGAVDPLGVTLILSPRSPNVYASSYVDLLSHLEGLSNNLIFRSKKQPYP